MRSAVLSLILGSALGACISAEPPQAKLEHTVEELGPAGSYVGLETCARCHEEAVALWRGSHHDLAMQEVREDTILGSFDGQIFEQAGFTASFERRDGRFFVRTEGLDGKVGEFPVAYVFGVDPLQQYLLELPGGRFQAFTVAWDTRPEAEGGQRWFHLYPGEHIEPGDPLHWTGRLQNWNLMCAECHSTRLEKAYDFEADAYNTTSLEIDVSCEACHGPGSRHVAWAEMDEASRPADPEMVVDLSDDDGGTWVMDMSTGLSKRQPGRASRSEIETCARCHARRSAQQADYVHGEPLLDTHRVALLEEPFYFPDGQILDEVYVYGSFLQSKMYQEGVTCKDCHEPHSQRIRGGGESVCGACHDVGRFESRNHHFHEPGTEGASCLACHMSSRTYMLVDARRDHSFRVPRPDLSRTLGTPNACNDCHRARSARWALEAVESWYGAEREPHYGETLSAGRRGAVGAGDALARLASDPEMPGIVRATALKSLSGIHSTKTLSAVEAALSDEDPLVRLGALQGASALAPAARRQLAVPLLVDPILNVRLEAARLLSMVPAESLSATERQMLDAAVEEYRKAQLRNADWPESHMNLALLSLSLGELEEARRSYENALHLDPEFVGAYINLVDLHRLEARDAEGEALLRRGLRHVPDSPELHHALGLVLVRRGRDVEALEELRVAAEGDPEEPRYAYVYGVALDGAGETARAISVLETALERHPQERKLLYALAAFEAKRGRRMAAVEYARRLVEASPGDDDARRLLEQLGAGARR